MPIYEEILKDQKQPQGDVTFILHKGGEFNKDTQQFENAEIISTEEAHNLIVDSASTLMARRMYPGDALTSGMQYLAVGTGVGTGTTQAPQAEALTLAALRVELARKTFSSTSYLDTNSSPVAGPTGKIQLTTTFLEAEANGPIVEMGLFGGNATATSGSGYLFNHKVFPVINKDNTVRLTIIWNLTF